MPDGGHDGQGDGAQPSYDAGPEDGGPLAGRPAPVSDGRLPEEGRSTGHVWMGDICYVVFSLLWYLFGGGVDGQIKRTSCRWGVICCLPLLVLGWSTYLERSGDGYLLIYVGNS